eukprot:c37410_g1_i1 orf=21-215(+)
MFELCSHFVDEGSLLERGQCSKSRNISCDGKSTIQKYVTGLLSSKFYSFHSVVMVLASTTEKLK